MGDKYHIKEGIQKFPSFHYKELNDLILSREVFSKEDTINSLITLKNLLEQISNEVNNLVRTNLNSFNIQSSKYNKGTYYYKILSELNIIFCNSVLSKLDPNIEIFNFDKNEYLNQLKNQYGFNLDFNKKIEKLNILFEVLEKIKNSKHNCALSFLNIYFNFLICFIKELLEKINKFKQIKIDSIFNSYGFENENILLTLLINLEKLYTICIFIGYGYFVDENDIFNKEINSEDWKNISKISYEVICAGENDIQKKFREAATESEQIVTALLNSYNENSFGVTNAALYMSKFYTYNNSLLLMRIDSKKAQIAQDKNLTKELMSIVRWPVFKKIMRRVYQNIKYRKKFYIKKEYPDITLDYIQKLLKLMGNKDIDVSNINQKIIYKTSQDIINNKEIPQNELFTIKPPKHLKKYYVSTTLLHSSNIDFLYEKPSILNPFSYFQDQTTTKPENLMIFIHGGGFIGMSTHSHELFLRDWVNKLNIPIIGLNYGLSPEYKYPYGFNDVYQGYRWIINHCNDTLGFNPKKIILGGDSSGGTFVLSLIYLLIAKNEFENEKIRIPDLVLPLYPCCNTSMKNMGTSFLLSLKDFLLNDKFLLYVNEAYRGIYSNDDDPFLNPVNVKDCILKKLPRMVFQFGSCDPLRDDIVRLLAKIAKIQGLNVKAYEFREYNHGWNGFAKTEFLLKIPREILFLEIKDIL